MLKIIHSKFQLDLSNYDISIVEENVWFSDRFFTNYILPFSFKITDELNAALGDLLSYNSQSATTYFDVKFYHNGKEHDAVFEIEEIVGRDASGSLSFGLEELPNYNKKLSELDLDDFDIPNPETIYTHAENVITKTWPEVTHNFVQVHTDKFSADDAQWEAFEGIINKKIPGGSFVQNTYDAVNDKQLNKNIIIPQPYLLHVLSRGMLDAGYTLAGDVLTDTDLQKTLFSEISSYYHTINTDSEELYMHNQEYSSTQETILGIYSKNLILNQKGRYKIAGNITIRRWFLKANAGLSFNGQRIWSNTVGRNDPKFGTFTFPIDINVDFFEGATAIINFGSRQFYGDVVDDVFTDEPKVICDLSITQLSKLDDNGNLLPTLILPNKIKLNKCVPDITFGDFVKVLKNWKNLELIPDGSTMYMNYIENQLTVANSKSLKDFEVKLPKRLPTQGKSFLLKFQEVSSEEDYVYEEVYVDVKGVSSSGFIKQEDTAEIIINALPLPVIYKNNVSTAHHFLDDASKLKVVLYEGAQAKENLAEPPTGLLIPNIHEKHYKKWFVFRINGQNFNWSLKMYEEQLRDLTIRDKVFAYNNHHIIKSLNKDLVSPGVWLIEIETESLEHAIE